MEFARLAGFRGPGLPRFGRSCMLQRVTDSALPSIEVRERRRALARALFLSLLVHLAAGTGWELAARLGLVAKPPSALLAEQLLRLPPVLRVQESRSVPTSPQSEVPMMFIEVDPSQAAAQAPKDARYYSSQSTLAANPNPDPARLLKDPRIDGAQKNVPRTFDVLKPSPPPPPEPATVATAPERVPPAPAEPAPPKELPVPGDLAFNKPASRSPTVKPTPEVQPEQEQPLVQARARPRTLAEARQMRGMIEGQRMKQEGGVPRAGDVALMDVRGTTFGSYDAAVVAAVQSRWYNLLEDRKYALEKTGRVVLEFRLHYDGRITDVKPVETDVGDFWSLICQKAVEDPAPYARWSPEMRREIGRDFRDVRFTFYYN